MSAQVSSNVVFPSKILFLDICVKVLVWKFCLKVLGGSRKLGLNSGSGVLIYVPWNRGQFIFIPNPNQKSCDGKAKTRNHDGKAKIRNHNGKAETRNHDGRAKIRNQEEKAKIRNHDGKAKTKNHAMVKLKSEIMMEKLKPEIRIENLKSEIMQICYSSNGKVNSPSFSVWWDKIWILWISTNLLPPCSPLSTTYLSFTASNDFWYWEDIKKYLRWHLGLCLGRGST